MTTIHLIQHPPHLLDLAAGVASARKLIAQAGKDKADLVVFPETWLGGYPAWVFGMAEWDCADARHWFGKLVQASPTISDPAVIALREAARDAGITVVMGLNERARPAAATLFNSLVIIGPDGAIIGHHRKLLPTHTERLVWTPGDAAGLTVCDTPAGRLGGLICWEHWHPLARHALHAQDEQIHVALWPDMPAAHHTAIRAYAFEGRCFVASAATYLPMDAVPEDLRPAYIKGINGAEGLDGGSGIVGPDGEYRVGPVSGGETVVGTIDLRETIAFKHDLDVSGHYDRRDIFQLNINRHRDL